jgi:hypothetical protein
MRSSRLVRIAPLAAVAVSIVALALPAQAADRLTVGEYEVTVTMDGKTRTLTRCVTAEDAQDANADAKEGRERLAKIAQTCSIIQYDVEGNTVTIGMKCGDASSTSRTTYAGTSYITDTTDTFQEGGKPTVSKRHAEAKRVGDCK